MKAGDWVLDRYGSMGQVKQVGMEFDPHAIRVAWIVMGTNQIRSSFTKQKYLTIIDESVANIIWSNEICLRQQKI